MHINILHSYWETEHKLIQLRGLGKYFLPQACDFYFYVGVLQGLMCENSHGEAHGAPCITAALSPGFRSRWRRAGSRRRQARSSTA